MASIYKRKNKDGTSHWRAVVRKKGLPSVCMHFERKQEAEDWAYDTERKIDLGQFKFDQHKKTHTFAELADRFINDGALEHHRSSKDTLRHLYYWRSRFAAYGLVYLTPELIGKERQQLLEAPTQSGKKRTTATVNRYVASLSSLFSYAVRDLRWLDESPCRNIKKLKESKGRDRVLSSDETERLLEACRKSKSPYLYCITLIAITTGARQGEILNLAWRDIDFENKIAFIKETKNGRPRSVALCQPVIEELQRLYQIRDPHKPLAFASRTAFGRVDIKKAWQYALKQAAISNFRAHDLRHTFATMAAAQGASNMELATATGHRTLQMLLRYTHLDAQVTKKYSNQISDQILPNNKESV